MQRAAVVVSGSFMRMYFNICMYVRLHLEVYVQLKLTAK